MSSPAEWVSTKRGKKIIYNNVSMFEGYIYGIFTWCASVTQQFTRRQQHGEKIRAEVNSRQMG